MKKLATNTIGILMVLLSVYSCSDSKDDATIEAVETNEYYKDSSGKYVLELGDEGFNIYEDGNKYTTALATSKTTATNQTAYSYKYSGICVLPPAKIKLNLANNPNAPSKPGKLSITKNLKVIGGGYKPTPKPQFLGGSSYDCYECLIDGIPSDEYFLAVCNGQLSIGGSFSEDPALQSAKASLAQIKFNAPQTSQFVQTITSTGLYKCTKRN